MEIPKKLDMSQTQNRELKLYFFITKEMIPGKQPPLIKEGVLSVLSYDLDSAVVVANGVVQPGVGLVIGGNQTLKEILGVIRQPETSTPEESKPNKMMAIENFKTAILYAADEYISDAKDKAALKKIFGKISSKT